MNDNSRRRAQTWPYPRRVRFERELRRAATAWFDARECPRHSKYSFCLPSQGDWPRNLILPEVARYIAEEVQARTAEGRHFPLHDWVHHGLSSQAMLFNLVGPLIIANDLAPLQAACGEQGIAWPEGASHGSFEYEDRSVFNEDSGQPTSVDLVFTDEGERPRVFVEAKLVEPEFGACSVFKDGDCEGRNPVGNLSGCYLHHIGRRYWAVLQDLGFLTGPIRDDSMCILANHYQFFREVGLALSAEGVFVLLSDERSPTFYCERPDGTRGLMAYLLDLVPPSLRSRIGRISIQQLVAAIRVSGRHPWISEFERKYGLDAAFTERI